MTSKTWKIDKFQQREEKPSVVGDFYLLIRKSGKIQGILKLIFMPSESRAV